jgi:hypothetical protein
MTQETTGRTRAASRRISYRAVLALTVSLILLAWTALDRGRVDGAAARAPASRPGAPAEPAKEGAASFIDLQPQGNQQLKESFPGSHAGNNLAGLKPGIQTMQGQKFNIGEGLIHLANKRLKDALPEKVEGLKVDAKFVTLHVLHATAYSMADDTVIAKYVVHYEDKSTETIEVVYGRDVRDWWCHDGDEEPTRGKVAWTGSNLATRSTGNSLWLFALSWKNPKPDKKVVAIDYASTLTDAAPFVVAMTHTR